MADANDSYAAGGSHEELVSAVKELQRTDPMAKEQWVQYCTTEGQGTRDPSKHDVSFLRNFFDVRETIEVPQPTHAGIADLFKEAQRASPTFKQAWSAFRESMGGRYDDPTRNDESFLVSALEFMGQAACAQMTMATMSQGKGGSGGSWGSSGWWGGNSWGGNSGGWNSSDNGWEEGYSTNKRRRTESWSGGGVWSQPGAAPAASASKQALVEQVKTFQRTGEEQKQAWWAYTDQHGQVKDPARYEEWQLQEFLSTQGWA